MKFCGKNNKIKNVKFNIVKVSTQRNQKILIENKAKNIIK